MGSVSDPVKRNYDNQGRRARSDETRRRVLEVARELLATKGYRGTKVTEIARLAHVHIDTVYALVGRKPAIVQELIEMAISGEDEPRPPEEREYVKRMHAESDPAKRLAIYASAICAIQARMAPLLLALRDAGATEPEAATVWHHIEQRRATNMRRLVAELGNGAVRAGITNDEAADVIWATASAEMYVLLTGERGWSKRRFEEWLLDTWRRVLLTES